MTYEFGKNTLRNLESLRFAGNPKSEIIITAVKDFINYTPIDFTIIGNGGFRTARQQKELFDKGTSQLDGYLSKSYHQSGLAVDLVPWVNDTTTWEDKYTYYLSGAFMLYCREKELPITTGAFWSFKDPCHHQIGE